MKKKKEVHSNSLYNVQVVNRVFDILECLGSSQQGMRLNDLSAKLKLPLSTTHRLATLMTRRGYVEHDHESRRYFAGVKVLTLSNQVLGRLRVAEQAEPIMEELRKQTGVGVNLGVLHGSEVVCIHALESPQPGFWYTPVGQHRPAHASALGKAFLAYLPEREVKAIIKGKGLARFTPNTIVTIKELLSCLAQVRARDYAINDEELIEGQRCVASAVFDHKGKVIAAVSVSGPVARMQKANDGQVGRLVRRAAESISLRMGYNPVSSGTRFFQTR